MGKITCIRNSSLKSNTYLYLLNDSKECLIIDPGLESELITEEIQTQGLTPTAILCTHGHFDHIGSAQILADMYNIEIYIHEKDKKVTKSANFLLMICKIKQKIQVPTVVNWVIGASNSFEINNTKITYHHAPGHTAGSCLIEIEDSLFTGDTLFRNFVVEDSITGSDSKTLKESLVKYISFFPGEIEVYPGHGGSASLNQIVSNNTDLRKFLCLSIDATEGNINHEL
ncbi:MAG: MBL fold metallo-hydrolase [Halobacteriovoraceae bacterium]|nr:MBL fold metallo-hydrolase [Halobacteriovoraceae bacterium]